MIEKSWNQLKDNFIGIMGFNAFMFGISLILSIFSIFIDDGVYVVLSLLSNIATILISIFFLKYIIRVVSIRGKASIKDLTSNMFADILRMLCVCFIMGLIIYVPVIIVSIIIVGSTMTPIFLDGNITTVSWSSIGLIIFMYIFIFIVSIFMTFVQYAVLDESLEDLSFGQRFILALKLTKGYKLKLIGTHILIVLVNMLGLLCFFIGLLITIPLSQLFIANVYVEARDRYLYGNINNNYNNDDYNYNNESIDFKSEF